MSMPLLWEFPGGKVEGGEQPEGALVRELNEELGIEAEVGALLGRTVWSPETPGSAIELLLYRVSFQGKVVLSEHLSFAWFTTEELNRLDMPEADRALLPAVCDAMIRG